jgi:hypothetical protein
LGLTVLASLLLLLNQGEVVSGLLLILRACLSLDFFPILLVHWCRSPIRQAPSTARPPALPSSPSTDPQSQFRPDVSVVDQQIKLLHVTASLSG